MRKTKGKWNHGDEYDKSDDKEAKKETDAGEKSRNELVNYTVYRNTQIYCFVTSYRNPMQIKRLKKPLKHKTKTDREYKNPK